MSSGIVWFRRDLRLDDNPAWAAATQAHDHVVPLVILEPKLLDNAGPFRRAAFVLALHDLDRALGQRGGRLHVAHGDPTTVLLQQLDEPGTDRIYANADVSRWAQRRDRAVDDATDQAVEWSWGTLVQRPGDVLTKAGTLSKVFTPFWKRWAAIPLPPEAVEGTATPRDDQGIGLPPVLDHQPVRPTSNWEQLVEDYESGRDTPSISGTSRLSTALRFGTVSARRLAEEFGTHTSGRQGFVRQLAWRDWYAHTTLQFPDIDRRAIRPEFDTIRWEQGPDADRDFAAWQSGRTGYPIVDAGMRELAATGWMHNRVRMIAASFLVKDLLIDWRRGERHFRHLLSDAEPSQNAGNWQWVAGTGPDAAPYFRIFNPVTQSRRFDPDGLYIRQWVPELAALDNSAVHAPWETAPLDLAAAGIVLDDTYPAPIIDHAVARDRTLAAYSTALER